MISLVLSTLLVSQIPVDKAAHFGLAGTAQVVCTGLLKPALEKTAANITCFTAINLLSIGKEIVDPYRGGKRELNDIIAGTLGSGISFTVIQIGF